MPSCHVRSSISSLYDRSGSSLLGDLVSSLDNNTAYYFEPLLGLAKRIGFAALDEGDRRAETLLKSVFACQARSRRQAGVCWSSYAGFRRCAAKCAEAKMVVVKEIRAHSTHLAGFFATNRIKVLHLVRDPRAIFESMRRRPGIWAAHMADPDLNCRRLRADVAMGEQLGHAYRRLRYEDLTSQPLDSLKNIADFVLDSRVDEKRLEAIVKRHFESSSTWSKGANYYSTVRNISRLKPDRWEKKLPESVKSHYAKKCNDILTLLNYSH